MHEGHTEDGVLHQCGICGCHVHMLDPEEMDWICDPCSFGGWSGIRSAWRLTPGDVIKLGVHRRTYCVVGADDVGKFRELVLRGEDGEVATRFVRQERKVYIHADRQPV